MAKSGKVDVKGGEVAGRQKFDKIGVSANKAVLVKVKAKPGGGCDRTEGQQNRREFKKSASEGSIQAWPVRRRAISSTKRCKVGDRPSWRRTVEASSDCAPSLTAFSG